MFQERHVRKKNVQIRAHTCVRPTPFLIRASQAFRHALCNLFTARRQLSTSPGTLGKTSAPIEGSDYDENGFGLRRWGLYRRAPR